MAWIKVRSDLCDDPAVIAISERLGIAQEHVVGCLVRFWSWADQQTRDGNATGVTTSWLDHHTRVAGFADALVAVGWLHVTEAGIGIPRFDRHMSQSAKRRALTSDRVRRHRERFCNGAGVTPPLPDKIREELNTEPTLTLPRGGEAPPGLRTTLRRAADGAASLDAAGFHSAIQVALESDGWKCEREVRVPNRGDGRVGRIDVVAKKGRHVVAIELDREMPRSKSLAKMAGCQGATLRVVVLRGPWSGAPPDGVDLVVGSRTQPYPADFLTFWSAYPRKIGKGAAAKAWAKRKGIPLADILQALEKYQRTEQWRRDEGQYIPHPATWLNQRRWEDEPEIDAATRDAGEARDYVAEQILERARDPRRDPHD